MKNKKAKILLFDIENSPLISYTWGIWEQNVIEVKEEWYVLSCAYKWLGDKNTKVLSLPQFKNWKKNKKDDSGLIEAIWELLNEADIVIAHNGNSFDVKKLYSRFLQHGMQPPKPFEKIDTLLIARKYFKFDSNKLDRLGQYLGVGRKVKHEGFPLWLGCMEGDMKSWKKMCIYNKQDVVLLEEVYYKLLPYITNHPNVNTTLQTIKNCPNCGSSKIHKKGYGVNKVSKYERLQCQNCSSWFKGNNIK